VFAGLWLCGLVSIANAQAVPEGEAETEAAGPSERDGEARRLYEAGVVAFDDGTFEAALSLFQRAYELSPRPQMLYNIGSAADRLRQNTIALEAFQAYLEALPEADNANGVRRRVELLEAQIARDAELQQAASVQNVANAAVVAEGPGPVVPIELEEEPPSRGWIWGVVVAAVLVVAGGVVLGVVLSGDDQASPPPNDFILQTSLWSGR
jgi:tetratricopeptide (TPR) repeat protein